MTKDDIEIRLELVDRDIKVSVYYKKVLVHINIETLGKLRKFFYKKKITPELLDQIKREAYSLLFNDKDFFGKTAAIDFDIENYQILTNLTDYFLDKKKNHE